MNLQFNSIIELIQAFPDEKTCVKYLEKTRWNGKVISPFDETSKVYKCKRGYKCKNTGKYFNVKTGTLFQDTQLPLQKWFIMIWLITSHNKGITSIQLARHIGITQASAWYNLQKIRTCMGIEVEELQNHVEMDEAFIGPSLSKMSRKRRGKHKISEKGKYSHKTPVVGMVERNGNIIFKVVPDVTQTTLHTLVYSYIKMGSVLHTDEWGGYNGLEQDYERRFVEHSKGIFGTEETNTNTIEGSWTILKKTLAMYYHADPKHLQRYADEVGFRYNTRKLTGYGKFNRLLSNMYNNITYNQIKLGYEKAA